MKQMDKQIKELQEQIGNSLTPKESYHMNSLEEAEAEMKKRKKGARRIYAYTEDYDWSSQRLFSMVFYFNCSSTNSERILIP